MTGMMATTVTQAQFAIHSTTARKSAKEGCIRDRWAQESTNGPDARPQGMPPVDLRRGQNSLLHGHQQRRHCQVWEPGEMSVSSS